MPGASVEEIRAACVWLLSDPHFLADARKLGDKDAKNSTVVS
jgi:hypothetical protein